MKKRLGKQTVVLPSMPKIVTGAAFAGPKEGEGPLKGYYDCVIEEDSFGEETWEKAECKLFFSAVKKCLEKGGISEKKADYLLGGDLTNQIMVSSIAARELGIPYMGLYGACSTMAESLGLGAMLVEGGFAENLVCAASSHFCTAERQYRFPLEYGGQRPPTAQWTVTGAGATLLSADAKAKAIAGITHVTMGRVVDMGIKDANNMGAAMAPAAAATLAAHFEDAGRSANDYDLIVTGDLGRIGHELLLELMEKKGCPLNADTYMDCGLQVFDATQDTHAGGSGCGCSAITLNGLLLDGFIKSKWRRILFMATGALVSPTSSQQGNSIPGIAHAVAIEKEPY